MEWHRSEQSRPLKAKRHPSAGKVFAIVFLIAKEHCLSIRQAVNATYYCVKTAYRSKRCNQPTREVILLHDNARSHTAALTRDKLDQILSALIYLHVIFNSLVH